MSRNESKTYLKLAKELRSTNRAITKANKELVLSCILEPDQPYHQFMLKVEIAQLDKRVKRLKQVLSKANRHKWLQKIANEP